jgi:hypothetical protein
MSKTNLELVELIEKIEELMSFLEDSDVCDEHYIQYSNHEGGEIINSSRTAEFQNLINTVKEELDKTNEEGE